MYIVQLPSCVCIYLSCNQVKLSIGQLHVCEHVYICSSVANVCACLQLLFKISLDSDFCHNYLHTICT